MIKSAEPEGEAFNLLVDVLLCRVSGPLRWECRVQLLILQIERNQLMLFRHLFRMLPLMHLWVFQVCLIGRRPRGRPRIGCRDSIFHVAWECLGIPRKSRRMWLGYRGTSGLCMLCVCLYCNSGSTDTQKWEYSNMQMSTPTFTSSKNLLGDYFQCSLHLIEINCS